MKKLALTFAIASSLSTMAHSDDDLFSVFGVLDIAYGSQSNGLPANNNIGGSINSSVYFSGTNPNVGPSTGLWSGGLSQDRIGIKGRKSFANGWRAGYLADTGFNIVGLKLVNADQAIVDNSGRTAANYVSSSSNSSQNGQFFNREAYASFGYGGFGDIRLGRNQSNLNDAAGGVAPFQNSQIFSLLGSSSAFGGGVGVSEAVRLNNSIKYLNKFGDVNFSAMYAGGDGTALTNQGNMSGLGIGYQANGLNVQYAFSSVTDVVKQSQSTTAGDISAKIYNAQGWLLGAAYDINKSWNIQVGTSQYTLSAPSDSANLPGSINGFAIAPVMVAGLNSGSSQTAQLYWSGVTFKASDKWTLYGTYQQAQYPGYKNGATVYTDGDVSWTAAMATYSYNKETDIYAAFADIRLSNTTSSSAIAGSKPISNNQLLGIGVRYKF